jgi:hypothetical protein
MLGRWLTKATAGDADRAKKIFGPPLPLFIPIVLSRAVLWSAVSAFFLLTGAAWDFRPRQRGVRLPAIT